MSDGRTARSFTIWTQSGSCRFNSVMRSVARGVTDVDVGSGALLGLLGPTGKEEVESVRRQLLAR